MRPVFGVVANIFAHQHFQMPFIEHNEVVKQTASAIAKPAFFRPRSATDYGTWCPLAGAEAPNDTDHIFVAFATRSNKIFGRAGRIPDDVTVKNEPSAIKDREKKELACGSSE